MNTLTREQVGYPHHLTVGNLLKFIEKHNLPHDAPVMVERVEDSYFTDRPHTSYNTGIIMKGWPVYLKEGQFWHEAIEWNGRVERGEFLNKEQYPLIHDNPSTHSLDDLEQLKDQYIQPWCCTHYKDDPNILFINMHY